jgi:hypothetical protein
MGSVWTSGCDTFSGVGDMGLVRYRFFVFDLDCGLDFRRARLGLISLLRIRSGLVLIFVALRMPIWILFYSSD